MTRSRTAGRNLESAIFTITPNPALDLGGVVKNLKPNEKSYVFEETRNPGGNSINSARILNRLGFPVLASGFLGGSTGIEIEDLLCGEQLQSEFIKISGSTRINVTVSNKSTHEQTRLSFPGPSIRRIEKQQLLGLFEKQRNLSFMLLGGSLPKGFTPADIIRLMKAARGKGVHSVIDCPGHILAQILVAKPFLIKPNLEEFQELTNSHVKSIGSVIEKGKKILEHTPYLCVSSVEGGTLLMTRKNIYFGRIPKIKIKSSVGAGDSMVGAMVAQLSLGNRSDDSVLRLGLGAAAATLAESGTTLGSAREILRLSKKSSVEHLK
jgi:1-phosphofructokinase family hexose kinase